MDQRLIDALERHAGIDHWTARRQLARGVQVFLVGNRVENVRNVTRDAYEVEVHNDHVADGEPARGSAVIPLARDELGGLETILTDAVAMASLVHNRPWPLAEPAHIPDVELADDRLLTDADRLSATSEAADAIVDLVERERPSGVRLSAAELFVTTIEEELRNSRGIAAASVGTRVMLEMTLLARDDGDEAEHFRQAEARRLADLRLPDLVAEAATWARDTLRAEAPRTSSGPVIISGEALGQLMGASVIGDPTGYLFHTSAAAAYSKLSRFEVGASVYGDREPTGDRVNLRVNARRPFGGTSYRFDADGVPAHDLLVIEDGVLRARPAAQRFAAYLGIPTTGRSGVAELAPGEVADAELAGGEPACRVVNFSAANVEAVTANFGMEIRLGYEEGPDGPRPIKGGSVSGNLFEAMADARFSAEIREFSNYAGPRAIRFEKLQVSGSD
jgi:PmbA protein